MPNIIYKILGIRCLCKPFYPAPTFVTADSDDARNPQHFIYVTVRLRKNHSRIPTDGCRKVQILKCQGVKNSFCADSR